MPFLPPDYEAPASDGRYMKLVTGKNKVRVLSPAIVGNEFWVNDGQKRKPVRRRLNERIDPAELAIDQRGEREKVKHFWAFLVWNYLASAVQILEITQGSIRDGIQALCADEDWGDPLGFDISITKSGAGLDTNYSVTPSNKAPTAPQILAAQRAVGTINLEALFAGGDPFAVGHAPAAATAPAAAASPIEAARKAAFLTMKDTMPDASPEALKAAWLKLVAQHFPTRHQSQVTAPEWQQLVTTLRSTYAGEPEVPAIPMDDIPF